MPQNTTGTSATENATPAAGITGLFGWVLFDWAAQPFYTLITTFLFAPYFANVVMSDPISGQAAWGYAAAMAGLLVAVLSPVFGAIADISGNRKTWIAIFSLMMCIGMALLWWAEPGAEHRAVAILSAFVLATVGAEFAIVFTNAMMPDLVPRSGLGRLSGIGWAAGYAGGLVSLILMSGFVIADVATGRTMLGLAPILPLDQAAHEGERLLGPLSALWYLVFMIPFALFTPDGGGSGNDTTNGGSAIQSGLRQLWQTVASLKEYRVLALFLLARMLYIDGLAAIFTFGGIYAAAIFGWGALELGIFGIILTIAGALGAVIGGVLDDYWGAARVILLALGGLIVAALGVLSVDKSHLLFVFPAEAIAGEGGVFSSAGERFYIGLAILIGLVSGPLQSASRTALARLAPSDKITEFFGFYAFSGKVTSFAAPLLVGVVTALANSQRIGIAVVLLFLFAGLALMLWISKDMNEAMLSR